MARSGAARRPHREDSGVARGWDICRGHVASGPVVRILPTVLRAVKATEER